MHVVVDANILIAALLTPDGWTARELQREDIAWVAPETLLDEVRTHQDEIIEKAGLSIETFEHRIDQLLQRIELVPHKTLVRAADSDIVKEALEIDPKDALYLACIEATTAALLWTRDTALIEAFPALAVRVVPRPEEP